MTVPSNFLYTLLLCFIIQYVIVFVHCKTHRTDNLMFDSVINIYKENQFNHRIMAKGKITNF